MSNYGRNFEVVATPPACGRTNGAVPSTGSRLPIGIPIQLDVSEDLTALNLQPVEVPSNGAARAEGSGQGVLVYEYGPVAFAGEDPAVTLYSDMDTVPLGAAVQVVHGAGSGTRVLFRNTTTSTFLNTVEYTGRIMVAGLGGATPTIAVGDYLVPGVGNDTDGWWKETATAGEAWLRVVAVDNDRDECVAELLV